RRDPLHRNALARLRRRGAAGRARRFPEPREALREDQPADPARALKETNVQRNLLVRVATVLVLLPIVLWLLWIGGLPFALLVSFAAAACAWELNSLEENRASGTNPSLRRPVRGGVIASTTAAFLLPVTEGREV